MLAEFILPIPVRLLNLSLNAQSSLVLVNLGLQLLLVRFSLGHHAIHSLFEQNFQLSTLTQVTIILQPCLFQYLSFVFHHLTQLINHSLITNDLFVLRLYLLCPFVVERPRFCIHRWYKRLSACSCDRLAAIHGLRQPCAIMIRLLNWLIFVNLIQIYLFFVPITLSFLQNLVEFCDFFGQFLVLFFL